MFVKMVLAAATATMIVGCVIVATILIIMLVMRVIMFAHIKLCVLSVKLYRIISQPGNYYNNKYLPKNGSFCQAKSYIFVKSYKSYIKVTNLLYIFNIDYKM